MDAALTKYITEVTDKTNYLSLAQANSHNYLTDFVPVYDTYLAKFPTDTPAWLKDKMLLNTHTFQEKQFIQYACEATIVKYFADRYNTNLAIEKKINPNNQKDVDLVFSVDEFTFNIEIKCSDFAQKEKIDAKPSLKIQTIGRLDGLDETMKELAPVFAQLADKMNLAGGFELAKNMDNNLKDFLKSANEKFNPNATDKELNVLSVSCNDAEDMQLWYYYMFKDKGLFKADSFCPHSDYENVDVVLLNNLYFKHNKYNTKNLTNSWDLGNAFSVVFINPFSKLKKNDAITKFLTLFPNYNNEFRAFKMEGPAEESVKDSRRMLHFIKAQLEAKDKIYLFEQL